MTVGGGGLLYFNNLNLNEMTMILHYCKKLDEKKQKYSCEILCEFCAGYTKGYIKAFNEIQKK